MKIVFFVILITFTFFYLFGDVVMEYYFHPAKVQGRKHADYDDWTYSKAEIPVTSVSDDFESTMKVDVKYSDELGKIYMRNMRPRCEGKRWEKNWVEVENEGMEKIIKNQF